MRALTLAVLTFSLVACSNEQDASTAHSPADMVLTNGNSVTVDETMPAAEAVAVNGDRITAVGSIAEISPVIDPRGGSGRKKGVTRRVASDHC